ncbi:ferredoxin family protein [Caballeronia sp. 15711]|uniref:4Fe-4S dicluster domain-containing protein n=1 Tax=Caballeronia sp. 15711 TaxID=3391029 RepID=UPI0039E50140
MIEFIADDICNGCGKCVEVCPTDVFELVPGKPPVIERLDDCHSCRQCALHCPESAIYVTLLNKPTPNLDRKAVIAAGKQRAYADWLGWKNGQPPGGDFNPASELLREKRGERIPDPSDRVRRQLYEAKDRNYI